jgi:hypothetical protein
MSRMLFWVPCLALLLFLQPSTAIADGSKDEHKDFFSFESNGKPIHFIFAPFTHHFSQSDDHEYVWLLGLEKETMSNGLVGITFFSNSFGQPSTYIYPFGGVYTNVFNVNGLFVKWSAGLIYGYKEPYEDKVPFNRNGFSPGFIPAIGYQGAAFNAQINVLNDAGLMLQFNWPLKTR